mgnify:CR=1 FL=1
MYRQGDVLLIPVDEIPHGCEQVKRDNGRIILAYGEVTGHAHAIKNRIAKYYKSDGNNYLELPKAATLNHEEHDTIHLPAGIYRVIQQREYTPEEIRNVAD